jgi:hypothetical protein
LGYSSESLLTTKGCDLARGKSRVDSLMPSEL